MGRKLRVLTYNIMLAKKLKNLKVRKTFYEELQKIDADVMAFQEFPGRGYFYKSFVREVFHRSYFHIHETFTHKNKQTQNNVLVFKKPILERKAFDLSVEGFQKRYYLEAMTQFDQNQLRFGNLHLGLKESERNYQIDQLMNFLHHHLDIPLILLGDFNDWKERLELKTHPQSQALEVFSAQKFKTFPSLFPLFSLDRVYFTKLKLIDIQRPYIKVFRRFSDHLPLVADFEI